MLKLASQEVGFKRLTCFCWLAIRSFDQRRILHTLLTSLLLISLSACGVDDNDEGRTIKVNYNDPELPSRLESAFSQWAEDSQLVGDKQRAKWAASKRRTRARGGVVQKRADWSWLKSLIGLQGWGWRGLIESCVCYCCGANRTSLPFTDP